MKTTGHLTEKQRYWLKHITTARAAGTPLSAYAKKHQLKLKALHNWAWKFKTLGIIEPSGSKPFVKVVRDKKLLPATTELNATLAVQIRFANDIQVQMPVSSMQLLSLLAKVKAL
jgi:hypothetical protein